MLEARPLRAEARVPDDLSAEVAQTQARTDLQVYPRQEAL
jgi:hypothetical protein